jgi:DNA-directed RNA polymerase specialized sigma24 family protein
MQTLTHDDFHSTCRSLVRRAQESRGADRSALYGAYWRPVRTFLRRIGAHTHEVEDITQGFFLRLEEKNALVRFDRARGKFRSWLRTCARRYFYGVRAHSNAEIHGGNATLLCADTAFAAVAPVELRESMEPERLSLEREAHGLVTAAENRLRSWYERRGKVRVFAVLFECLHAPDGATDAERASLLDETSGAIKQERFRMRKRFAAYVRMELRQRGTRASRMRKRLKELAAAVGEDGDGDA